MSPRDILRNKLHKIKAESQERIRQSEMDICRECGEHAEFDEETGESTCCGAAPIDPDTNIDMER